MRVFVTGGTGFVGEAIVERLRQQAHEPVLLVRRPGSAGGSTERAGNILQPETLAPAMLGCDAVIHLVGIISECGANTFENVHTRGTRNMVAAAQAAGIRRFVHMSALGTRPGAASRYHQTKWEAEEAVRSSGLDFTIFQPSLIYGPGDHFVNLFAKMMRFSPVVPVMGRVGTLFQPVHVAVVADAFVKSLTVPASVGQTFELCGLERFTLPQILRCISQATGRRRWQVKVPGPIARIQAATLEALFPLVGKAPPLNRDQLRMLNEDNVGDPEPARSLFGLQIGGFQEGIGRYLRS